MNRLMPNRPLFSLAGLRTSHFRIPANDNHAPCAEVIPPSPEEELRAVCDAELEWFFTMRESAMGAASIDELRSRKYNAGADYCAADDCAEAARAARKIRTWLLTISSVDAEILRTAYVPRPWTLELRTAFGRLTGIIVRLFAASIDWPESRVEQTKRETRLATVLHVVLVQGNAQDVEDLAKQAAPLYEHAVAKYQEARGDGPSVIGGAR